MMIKVNFPVVKNNSNVDNVDNVDNVANGPLAQELSFAGRQPLYSVHLGLVFICVLSFVLLFYVIYAPLPAEGAELLIQCSVVILESRDRRLYRPPIVCVILCNLMGFESVNFLACQC